MAVLITGICGRLGRLVTRSLHRKVQVVGIDRRPFEGRPKDVIHHRVDIRRKKTRDVFRAGGVDTLIEQSAAKAAAQSIRKVHELNWNPLHIIGASSASVETVLKPAGLEASKGLVTTQFLKQPGDPAWANDEDVKAYKDFLKTYAPSANPDDYSVIVAYMNVNAVTLALKKCGDQLTRENLIRQATSLDGERMPLMLPGIAISTRPDDYTPFRTLRIATFDGTSWTLSGDPISAE